MVAFALEMAPINIKKKQQRGKNMFLFSIMTELIILFG